MQHVKKHAVCEKVPMSPVLEGDKKRTPSRQAGRTRTRERPCASEYEISMGHEGMQHWTQSPTCLFSATSPLEGVKLVISGSSVKQPEGNSALGD